MKQILGGTKGATMVRALSLVLMALVACNRATSPGKAAAEEDEVITLSGAGSTFDSPLFWKWLSEYRKLHPKVIANYESVGILDHFERVSLASVHIFCACHRFASLSN